MRADLHGSVGTVPKAIKKIADPGAFSELQSKKDTAEPDPEHLGTDVHYEENDHGEQEREQYRSRPEISDQFREDGSGCEI